MSTSSIARPPPAAARARPRTRARPRRRADRRNSRAGHASRSAGQRRRERRATLDAAGSAWIHVPRVGDRARPAGRRDRACATAARPRRSTISPKVGFRPTRPHAAAGMRIEPPVSVPSVASAMPAATLAAEPPLDPPGDRDGSSGLRAGPNAESSLVVPNANSCRLVLPMMTAPASRSADDRPARRRRRRGPRARATPRSSACRRRRKVLDRDRERRAAGRDRARPPARDRPRRPAARGLVAITRMKAFSRGFSPRCARRQAR